MKQITQFFWKVRVLLYLLAQNVIPYIKKFFWKHAGYGFGYRNYELAIFEKLILKVLCSQNLRVRIQIDSELSIWAFGTSGAVIEHVTTGCHGLPYALPYMSPYFYGNYPRSLYKTTFNILPDVLLNVLQYIFSKIRTQLSLFQRVTTCYHQFF